MGLVLGGAIGMLWPKKKRDVSADRDMLLSRGQVAMSSDKLPDARDAIRRALVLDPDHQPSWDALQEVDRLMRKARLYERCDQLARAVERAKAAERVGLAKQLEATISNDYEPLLTAKERVDEAHALNAWRAIADTRCTIRVNGIPEQARVDLIRVDLPSRRLLLNAATPVDMPADASKGVTLRVDAGRIVVRIRKSGKDSREHALFIPVDARQPSSVVEVMCAADPTTVPASMQFVPALHAEAPALWVDRKESHRCGIRCVSKDAFPG